jgi:hypothetical protein
MTTRTLESLELAIAQKRLRGYSAELARDGEESEECLECQRRIDEAVEAYRWVTRAEESIRQGVYEGLIEFTTQLDDAIQSLYRDWLALCEQTETLLARHLDRGGDPVDAGELSELSSLAREKINSMAWVRKSRTFRNEPACEASDN